MDLSTAIVRILKRGFAGAVLGLLVGLLLRVLRIIDNPFWLMSAGMFVAALTMGTHHTVRDLGHRGGSGGDPSSRPDGPGPAAGGGGAREHGA